MEEEAPGAAADADAVAPGIAPAPGLPVWLADPAGYHVAPALDLSELDAVAGYPRLAVQLLHNRDVTGAAAVRALLAGAASSDDVRLPDADVALARLMRARAADEEVVVWGDYDCDGMTSCALLTEALRGAGVLARPYLALREDDGRGLNTAGVEALAAEGVRLIVTTDCGTASRDEVEVAAHLGVDVIVTDHHPLHGELAHPLALVNPRRDERDPEIGDLAGVGVAYMLARDFLERAPVAAAREAAAALLDLVAIGTIADVAPLSRRNWRLVRAGLRRLNTAPRPGLRALLRSAGLPAGEVSARDIAFAVAPRLNACGRLGEPSLAVELLLCQDGTRAAELAVRVEALHQRRQGMTEELCARAKRLALERAGASPLRGLPGVLVAVDEGLPLGLIGLVAGRLSEDLGRAVFVVSRDGAECRGSGRAPLGYDLGALLAARAELFKRFGGHAQAAGFTIMTERLPELLAYLDGASQPDSPLGTSPSAAAAVAVAEQGRASSSASAPRRIDCKLPLRRLVPQNVRAIRDLEPYGAGFAEPVFLAPRVQIVAAWRSGQGGATLRLRIREGRAERTAIWPKCGALRDALAAEISSGLEVDLVYAVGTSRQSPEPLIRVLALLPPAEM